MLGKYWIELNGLTPYYLIFLLTVKTMGADVKTTVLFFEYDSVYTRQLGFPNYELMFDWQSSMYTFSDQI